MRGCLLAGLGGCVIVAMVVWWWPPPTLKALTYGLFGSDLKAQPAVLFTGDVFLGRAVERDLNARPQATPFDKVANLLKRYPNVVINFEAAIPTKHAPTPNFGWRFSVRAEKLPRLLPFVTHASVANNHSYDFGATDFVATTEALKAAKLQPLGHPQKVSQDIAYLQTANGKIALVALNDVGAGLVMAEAKNVIATAKQNAKLTVVYVHWGDEYVTTPSKRQRRLANAFAKAGADLIVGHHPHVVQSIERVGEAVVFYSLGNTVFDQYFSLAVQEGLLVGLVYDDGWFAKLYPVSSVNSQHQPRPQTKKHAKNFLAELAAHSTPSLRSFIRKGQLPLP